MRSVIELADVMKVSNEESILLTGAESYEDAADRLLAMGPKLLAAHLEKRVCLWQPKIEKRL